MGWTYRDIQTFPALYGNVMIKAAASLNEPVLFTSCKNELTARREKDNFRFYRWCLRKQPSVSPQLASLEERYQFRFSTDTWEGIIGLYITAKPTHLSELIDLNPQLASIVAEVCQ